MAAERAQRSREILNSFKNALPNLASELQQLRREEKGADWIHTRVALLRGKNAILPSPVLKVVRQIVGSGTGAITTQRMLTKEERDAAGAMGGGTISAFVEERIGQLDGYSVLANDDPLRKEAVAIQAFIDALDKADLESLPDKTLNALAKDGAQIEARLGRLREAVETGRRLLQPDNMAQLARFCSDKDDIKCFEAFIRNL